MTGSRLYGDFTLGSTYEQASTNLISSSLDYYSDISFL